mmetsp:Transcript_1966/g.4249  ORF Transcript_1966/g.4249 Transcript_1966/m.4249 type:complete len:263 (+) Transcript_1966:19-807(+)
MDYTEQNFIYLLSAVVLFFMIPSFLVLSTGVVAPYGRYAEVASSGLSWGWGVPCRTAWILQELPSLAGPLICYAVSDRREIDANVVLLTYWCCHYVNRTLVFPCRMRGGKKTPFGVFVAALVFCMINGYCNGRFLAEYAVYDKDHLSSPCFIIGSVVFWTGLFINFHSDGILRDLRKPGEVGYKIPYGGMFTYISGANYFGEIIEWIGFAIASGGAIPAVTFALATFLNIAPRACSHHDWYLQKFDDEYKKLNRKRLVPFIY